MATKQKVPAKGKKVAAKPAGKQPAKSVKVSPKKTAAVAKAAPAKKAAPKKVAKPAAKKTVTKVPVKKSVIKPAAKKATKPVAAAAKPSPKPAARPVAPTKNLAKTIAKQVTQSPATVKNSVKAAHPASKIMAKKEETKKVAATPAPEKAPAKAAAEAKPKEAKAPAPKPVVIPKISTKTVRKYQPEFTKSVLDKGQRDMGAPSQRYSDMELMEFKELIQRKLEAAKKELSYLHGLITRKDEMGGDEGDNRYMTMEDGSLSMEREQLSQMASRQITFIDHLEKAVMRIENKTYGICRVTGKLIDKARLRAVPHATLSIEAKMGANK
ncbi:MAG: TraR/DksA C4-type zinc finger protein [Ferruginibacter sp.]|nr:TraR/DksA C4-type zinc finger protein [Ferruginibacter sp.]